MCSSTITSNQVFLLFANQKKITNPLKNYNGCESDDHNKKIICNISQYDDDDYTLFFSFTDGDAMAKTMAVLTILIRNKFGHSQVEITICSLELTTTITNRKWHKLCDQTHTQTYKVRQVRIYIVRNNCCLTFGTI